MHSHVMLKRRRSPKIAEMPKEVACRDVVEMRAGLGKDHKTSRMPRDGERVRAPRQGAWK